MLVRLFGSNFRCFKDKFELSMVAADLRRDEDRERGIIRVPIAGTPEPLRLLRAVAIYGPNASGKSTVLTAAEALCWLATESSARSQPGGRIPPYEPFLLDDESRAAPINLGCDVVYKKSLLRYDITYEMQTIRRETLALLGENEIKLIDRKPSGEVQGNLITESAANQLYVKEMQPNVTVLSKLAQHGPHKGKESALPYYQAIRNATQKQDYSISATSPIVLGYAPQNDRFADDPEYREWIMNHLIHTADLGIRDVETRRERLNVPNALRELFSRMEGSSPMPDTRVVVSFVHKGKASRAIEFSHESAGTKKLFNIAGDWWALANESGTLFADELSASLHPRLLDRLLRAVNDARPVRARSQLVFTTHETGLLESQDGRPPALRRDQVYFTKKDASGGSELYSLAEFKEDARPVHNIRKRYLSGLYGAIPSVEKLSL